MPAGEPDFTPCGTAMPDWLGAEAAKLWPNLAEALHSNGMLTHASRDTLATYCSVLGAFIEGQKSGAPVDVKLLQAIRLLAREFGFTPSSQASISAPNKTDGKAEKDRFFG